MKAFAGQGRGRGCARGGSGSFPGARGMVFFLMRVLINAGRSCNIVLI